MNQPINFKDAVYQNSNYENRWVLWFSFGGHWFYAIEKNLEHSKLTYFESHSDINRYTLVGADPKYYDQLDSILGDIYGT